MAWIHNQGVFSVGNLVNLFPAMRDIYIGYDEAGQLWEVDELNAFNIYDPRDRAFDENWLPNGERPLDPRDAEP
jgi:hypothetical protein